MSPYSRFYRRAEQPAPVRIKRAHTTAAIADKSAGKIGNVDAAVYPISKIQDTVAKGYVGGFLDEKGRMILMAYAAAPSAYSEKDYQEYFEGFHWNEAQ